MALNQCDVGSTSCLHAQRMKKKINKIKAWNQIKEDNKSLKISTEVIFKNEV